MSIPHNGNGDTRWTEIYVMEEVLEGDYEFLRNVWLFAVCVLAAMVERATDIISGAEGVCLFATGLKKARAEGKKMSHCRRCVYFSHSLFFPLI
jgi:hypothetical protein